MVWRCLFSGHCSLSELTECDRKPSDEWRGVHRGQPAGRDRSLYVRPSGHGDSGWREGELLSAPASHTHMQQLFLCVSCWVFDAPLQIDLHIMTQPPSGEWVYFNTEVTNSSGRVSFVVPEDKRLGIGVYPVKMVVRLDFLFFWLFSLFLQIWMWSF